MHCWGGGAAQTASSGKVGGDSVTKVILFCNGSVMAYVVWKVQSGYGPYAYLRESVRVDGKVRAQHICYLGRHGGESATAAQAPGALWPGSMVLTPTGQSVRLPDFSPAVLKQLGTTGPGTPPKELGTTKPETVPTGAQAELGTKDHASPVDYLGTTPAAVPELCETVPAEELVTAKPDPSAGWAICRRRPGQSSCPAASGA